MLNIKRLTIFIVLLLSSVALPQNDNIIYHYPLNNAKFVQPAAAIGFRFNDKITEYLFQQIEINVNGTVSGKIAGNIKLLDDKATLIFTPSQKFTNGEKISVTYCPLTGSVIGYKGKNLGVSGVLYNSNLVLYDRETNSEIPQILGVGVTGDLRGTYLEQFPVIVTDWKHWKTQHPDTRVLSLETGHNRNYDRNPYPGYDDLLRVWFPLAAKSDKFKTKDWVFGIKNNGEFLAVPKEQFKTVQKDKIILGGDEIKLEYDSTFQTMRAYNENEEIPAIQMYWFAWYAYYPETRVWKQ